MSEIKRFRDPIHGFIEVRPRELQIINSPAFLRLRSIKQLALTNYIYPGAEHTRFSHSLGVMNLVTLAFNSAIEDFKEKFPDEKREYYEQILRLIALLHDVGHAPFSHASEDVLPDRKDHEDYTEAIITETEIAKIIEEIGRDFTDKYGPEYAINAKLICDIYRERDPGPNSEYTFLNSFMDSELDCDKMDYLLRDSYFCGVKYGMYDVERLLASFTICYKDQVPRIAIKSGGIQTFEDFVLARYFMFIQVYFHHTRRYFDIMLNKALSQILPGGTYPKDVEEYLKWDDSRVMQLLKENAKSNDACKNIIERKISPMVFETKVHPTEADLREFERNITDLNELVGEENLLVDQAVKLPHKIPQRVDEETEKAIIIYHKENARKTTISEESEIIKALTSKIDIKRIYCSPEKADEAKAFLAKYEMG